MHCGEILGTGGQEVDKRSALLDLRILTNDELIRNMKTAGSLSPRKMVVFVTLKREKKAKGVQQSSLMLKGHFLKACK